MVSVRSSVCRRKLVHSISLMPFEKTFGRLSPYDHSCWWDAKHKHTLYYYRLKWSFIILSDIIYTWLLVSTACLSLTLGRGICHLLMDIFLTHHLFSFFVCVPAAKTLGSIYQLSWGMRFPTILHSDKCRLIRACAASF